MRNRDELAVEEIVELLNRCWMSHDGMWFFQCFRTLGIDQANLLNKSAIRSLAPLEIARLRQAMGKEDNRIESYTEFKEFFTFAAKLVIPDFMGARMSFPRENTLHWEFEPAQCFAYRGLKRIGAIEGYECGVIYRIECWLEALGLAFEVKPRPVRCLMLAGGACAGDFEIVFAE